MHSPTLRTTRRALLLATALLVGTNNPATAQCATCPDSKKSHATRAELEALAASAEEAFPNQPAEVQRARRVEASRIRDRLQQGDFAAGDRVILAVQGQEALTDTFTVRAAGLLSLPNLPDVSLYGVLRAELQPHLATHIGRYLRNPSVAASSLIRLAVIGEVQRPGFYPVPADVPLSDIVMSAGGPTQNADLARMSIRRGTTELLSTTDVRIAVANGLTVDQLNLRSGDEIAVGARARTNWTLVLTSVTAVMGVVTTAIALGN